MGNCDGKIPQKLKSIPQNMGTPSILCGAKNEQIFTSKIFNAGNHWPKTQVLFESPALPEGLETAAAEHTGNYWKPWMVESVWFCSPELQTNTRK